MRLRPTPIATLLAMFALSAPAGTLRIVPYADGTAVTDAEACFWRGRNFDDFFDRFLVSGDVRCYPITDVPQPPDGVWNYYVQSRTRTSTHPDGIELRGPGGVRPMKADLLPAGTLDISAATPALGPDEYFAVYITNEHHDISQPSVRPIPRDVSHVLIPAEMHVLLLVISGEQIVWASRPLLVHESGTLQVPPPDRAAREVVLIVGLDRTVHSLERDTIKGTPPPTVSLIGKQRTLHPALGLRAAPVFDTSIVVFTDVPPGDYTARIAGDYWLPDEARVSVSAAARTIAQPSRRLVTRPCSRVEIHWHAPPAGRYARPPTCTPPPAAATPATTHLSITHCAFGFGAPADCLSVHEEDVHGATGVRTLDQMPPGDYYVTLRNATTNTREHCSVRPARTAGVTISLAPGHITGRVTRDGAPLRAIVGFATGATSTDEQGQYDAFVAASPGDRPVVVTPCVTQQEYVDLPRQPLRFDDTYDIDVPDNQLTITVVDAVTGAPLPNTNVTNRIITPEHTISSRTVGNTNAAGVIIDRALSPHVTMELCARQIAYEGACVGNIQMRQADESTTIALRPARGRTVRIIADPPIGPGRVYVVAGSSIVGEALIEPDHSIRLEPTTPAATLYIVAINYPLLRLPLPDLTQATPVIVVPAVRGVTRTVTLSPDTSHHGGPIGLAIDGTPMPDALLMHAQALHNTSEPYVRPGETIAIGPVDETLHITVLLWRDNADLPADLRVPDPFTNPSTAGLVYRAPLTGTHVTLTPER